MLECCLRKGEDEFCVGDHVERLGEVYRHGHRSVWWPVLVEAQGHFVCEGEEGRGRASYAYSSPGEGWISCDGPPSELM